MILKKILQILKFSIVGVINTLLSLLIYYILLGLCFHYNIATICGYIGSSIVGYFLNKIWVFQAKENSFRDSLMKYYIVYISALVLNLFCMYLWIQLLQISDKIAPLLTLCITIPYNFLWSKFWVFKKGEKGK